MNSLSAPIIHPTDFSDLSNNAFAHALRISVAVKAKLYVAHIAGRSAKDWQSFPHIRPTLARWGLLDAYSSPAAIFDQLGVEVAKVEIDSHDPVRGLARFLASHPSELMVLATHGRDGMPRWFQPSVAEAMSRRARTQTLFIPGQGAGFVDYDGGGLHLERILVPVDHSPDPTSAIAAVRRFCVALGAQPTIRLLHVGTSPPVQSDNFPIDLRNGDVVDTILQVAADMKANLIAMATAGHQGLLDAIRGSTTERVLRQAPCPVLAIPVTGRL